MINAQSFVQNDAERVRVQQILNSNVSIEIPLDKKNELESFFINKNISKPEAEKYQYLLKPLFNESISKEDWNFYLMYLKNNFSENVRFPFDFLLKLKK